MPAQTSTTQTATPVPSQTHRTGQTLDPAARDAELRALIEASIGRRLAAAPNGLWPEGMPVASPETAHIVPGSYTGRR